MHANSDDIPWEVGKVHRNPAETRELRWISVNLPKECHQRVSSPINLGKEQSR